MADVKMEMQSEYDTTSGIKSEDIGENRSIKSEPSISQTCTMCSVSVRSETEKLEHVWRIHMKDPKALHCPRCSYRTGMQMEMYDCHHERCHPTQIKLPVTDNRHKFQSTLDGFLNRCFPTNQTPQPKSRNVKTICQLCKSIVADYRGAKVRHIWLDHMESPELLLCPLDGFSTGFEINEMKVHWGMKHPHESFEIIDRREQHERTLNALQKVCFGFYNSRYRSSSSSSDSEKSHFTNTHTPNAKRRKIWKKTKERIACVLCDRKVISTSNYRLRHVYMAHLGSPTLLNCPECYLGFKGLYLHHIKKHMNSQHNIHNVDTILDRRPKYEDRIRDLDKQCFPGGKE